MNGLEEARVQFGDIVRLQAGPWLRVFLVNHPNYIHHLLVRRHKYYRKIRLYKLVDLAFGQGLFTSEGELWRKQRRLLQPFFQKPDMEKYSKTITDAAEQKMNAWRKGLGGSKVTDIEPEMLDIAQAIIVESLFKADITEEIREARNAFFKAVSPSPIFGRLPIPTHKRQLARTVKRLDRVVWKTIHKRRIAVQLTDDLLTEFMQAEDRHSGYQMDDKQLRDEIMTIIFTGDETSAQALTWTWYLLSQNAAAEEKLHEELSSVLDGRTPTFEDLARLPYTCMVVDESMRLYPPAWANARVALKPDRIGGYDIPTNSIVIYSQHVMHRHPDYWENPEEFDPERFSAERSSKRPEFAYFPFGGGPRQCLGRHFALIEIQLILATMAQQFRMRLAPGHLVESDPNVALRPRHGMKMEIEQISL